MAKLMNKRQAHMEQMVALLLLAYTIGLLAGETLRDALFGEVIKTDQPVAEQEHIPGQPTLKQSKKWKLYSGLFILLRQNICLPTDRWRQLMRAVSADFALLVRHPVRTYV